MDDNSRDRLTLARRFLEPSNSTHRQYEALRAFFVEGLPSAEAAARFGYTPGASASSSISFAISPTATSSSRPQRQGRPPGKQKRLREQVVALRKQNLSVHDISRALARDGESLSPAAVAAILKEEGFAKLPRRLDDERPDQPRPVVAEVADVRRLDLTPRNFRTKFGGLFLFLPWLIVRRPGQAPRPGRLPRLEDDPGRVRRAVAAGPEALRQRTPQSRHELRARRGLGSLRRLECRSRSGRS